MEFLNGWERQRIRGFLLVLLLAFLVLAASASYERYVARKVAYLAVLEPPARYNHPYRGPVIERVTSEAEVLKGFASSPGTILPPALLARGWIRALATWFYRATDQRQLMFTVATKPPIAMVGRKIIRKIKLRNGVSSPQRTSSR